MKKKKMIKTWENIKPYFEIFCMAFLIFLVLALAIIVIYGHNYYHAIQETGINEGCDFITYEDGKKYCFKNSTLHRAFFKCEGIFNVKCEMFEIKDGT